MGRDLQLEEFEQPEPGFQGAIEFVDPSAGEVVKGVLASLTTISFTHYAIDISPVAPAAKDASIFPALFAQVKPGSIFASNEVFEAFYVHLHHATIGNLVSKAL